MVSLVWNEEDAKKSYIAQGREEGIVQGREEGIVQGREEGIVQGREEGKIENALENVRNLMDSMHWTAEAAMVALKLSPEMRKELTPLI